MKRKVQGTIKVYWNERQILKMPYVRPREREFLESLRVDPFFSGDSSTKAITRARRTAMAPVAEKGEYSLANPGTTKRASG